MKYLFLILLSFNSFCNSLDGYIVRDLEDSNLLFNLKANNLELNGKTIRDRSSLDFSKVELFVGSKNIEQSAIITTENTNIHVRGMLASTFIDGQSYYSNYNSHKNSLAFNGETNCKFIIKNNSLFNDSKECKISNEVVSYGELFKFVGRDIYVNFKIGSNIINGTLKNSTVQVNNVDSILSKLSINIKGSKHIESATNDLIVLIQLYASRLIR